MIKFLKNGVVNSNKGISIILAIIIIIVLGLAGSIFAYLMASGSITSRSNLTGAAAKYAAKSGVEITFYEIKHNGTFSGSPLPSCPNPPVLPPGVSGSIGSPQYLSGNLQGNLPHSVNYTPAFCAVYGTLSSTGGGNCTYYIITSNGFAGGTEREVTAEVVIKSGTGGSSCPASGGGTGIYVEAELPNS